MNDRTDLNWLHVGAKVRYIGDMDDVLVVTGEIYIIQEIVEHPVWKHWYGISVGDYFFYALRDPLEDRFEPELSRPREDYPLMWEPVDG